MAMSAASNALLGTPSNEGLAPRYEALIRLAEVIRSHPDEKDLFRTCANELRQVIPFHGISQFDPAAKLVQWHVPEPDENALEAWREELAALLRTVPREESISRWVYDNQQPLIVRLDDRETRFRLIIDLLKKIGIRSLCALP